jgi:hypothetical protein
VAPSTCVRWRGLAAIRCLAAVPLQPGYINTFQKIWRGAILVAPEALDLHLSPGDTPYIERKTAQQKAVHPRGRQPCAAPLDSQTKIYGDFDEQDENNLRSTIWPCLPLWLEFERGSVPNDVPPRAGVSPSSQLQARAHLPLCSGIPCANIPPSIPLGAGVPSCAPDIHGRPFETSRKVFQDRSVKTGVPARIASVRQDGPAARSSGYHLSGASFTDREEARLYRQCQAGIVTTAAAVRSASAYSPLKTRMDSPIAGSARSANFGGAGAPVRSGAR